MSAPPFWASSALPLRLGDFETITDALDYAAAGSAGFSFYTPRGELAQVLTYANLRTSALSIARKLLGTGLRPGDRIALIAETGPDFPVCLFACLYAGIVPCIAPAETNVLARNSYLARIAGIIRSCGASALMASSKFTASESITVRLLRFSELYALPEIQGSLPSIKPESVAYIQFSSGSTTQPKGILISHAALMANIASIVKHGIRLTAADRAFSWLPFYHDMGLVGFLLAPLAGQCSVDYMAPSAFARRPLLWMQLMSALGSTISYAPTFGYRLAAERLRHSGLGGIDLSRWRLAGIGGDMIRNEVLEQFAVEFEPVGFDRKAFVPSYGLAEATLAVTFANEGLMTACPSSRSLDENRRYVVCGRPLPGYDVRIVDANGEPIADGAIGRVKIIGPSLMLGYVRETDDGLERGSDGYLDTGDLGFMTNGALVVTGRAKDLILINGRNVWPADIEWVVQQAANIRHGQTVAFSVTEPLGTSSAGAERVVILVEYRNQAPRDQLRVLIADAVSRQIGVAAEVGFVPPQTISMTSSGKLKRAAARDAYVAGTLPIS